MPRPRKHRTLSASPRPAVYKPAGVPLEGLRQVILPADELEALRLADLEGLTQEQAAERMDISRSSFQRTLAQARRQVALALVEGCALVLEGSLIDRTPSHPRRHGRTDADSSGSPQSQSRP